MINVLIIDKFPTDKCPNNNKAPKTAKIFIINPVHPQSNEK